MFNFVPLSYKCKSNLRIDPVKHSGHFLDTCVSESNVSQILSPCLTNVSPILVQSQNRPRQTFQLVKCYSNFIPLSGKYKSNLRIDPSNIQAKFWPIFWVSQMLVQFCPLVRLMLVQSQNIACQTFGTLLWGSTLFVQY